MVIAKKSTVLAALNARRLAKLRDMLSDDLEGTICLVGNAQAALAASSETGAEIDSHGLVIRMNNQYPSTPSSQGCRVDVMLISPPKGGLTKPLWILNGMMRSKTVVLMSPSTTRYGLIDLRWFAPFFPFDFHERLVETLDARPSTGAMAIELFSRLFGAKRIHLYGFDFWESASEGLGERRPGPHDPEKEKAYALRVLNRNQIH